MEFKTGESQRGGTIFESLLKNYPKKTDLWSIYIDMWTREQDFDQVRYINTQHILFIFSYKCLLSGLFNFNELLSLSFRVLSSLWNTSNGVFGISSD